MIGNCLFPCWTIGAQTTAQNWKNNWVILLPQITFSHKILHYLPVRRLSDISWHPHPFGMSASSRTKSSPHFPYLPPACIQEDVFILPKYNLTSSYSFSTAEPRYDDLDSTFAAPSDLSAGLSLYDLCCQRCSREKESILIFRSQVEPAGSTVGTWVHACACRG